MYNPESVSPQNNNISDKERAAKLAAMARPAEKRAETKRLTSDAMVEIGKDRLVENFTRKRNLRTPEQQDFQNN